jgi:hypothetical protein
MFINCNRCSRKSQITQETSHLEERDQHVSILLHSHHALTQCLIATQHAHLWCSIPVNPLLHTRATRRSTQCTAVTLVPASLFFASSILSISICFSLSSRLSGSIPSARSPNNKSICRFISHQFQADPQGRDVPPRASAAWFPVDLSSVLTGADTRPG